MYSSPFRIWNCSGRIPSPPLALFIVMLPRPTWLHTPGCQALGEWPHHQWLSGSLRAFLYSSEYSCHLFLISSASVQLLSHVQLFATPWTAACQASLSITNSWSLLKLMPIESVMPSSHLILCHPLFLLPPIPPSIRVFSNESTLRMRWPKYWSFSFSISPSNGHPESKGLSRVFSNTTVQKHLLGPCYFCPLSIVSMFAWNVSLISPVFLKRSLVSPILLFPSISLHCSLKKAFLPLLAILWNSAFSLV